MVGQQFIPAIRETVKLNEIGSGSPYKLEFAKKGTSGASFGFMQGDTNPQPDARDTLRAVLAAAGQAQDFIDRILAALSRPLPNGNPLNQADTDTVNAALASATGRPLVDAMPQDLDESYRRMVDGFASRDRKTYAGGPYCRWIGGTSFPSRIPLSER